MSDSTTKPEHGATLTGAEREAYVTDLFDRIARPYDRLNRMISLGRDRAWRRLALDAANLGEGDHAVDLGTGTGDIFVELRRRVGAEGTVIGCDLSKEMLEVAQRKAAAAFPHTRHDLRVGNAEHTELVGGEADVVTMAWVLRNVGDRLRTYAEVLRLLKPGGRFVCLDTSRCDSRLARVGCRIYMHGFMPLFVKLSGGDLEAYEYLTRSTELFPSKADLADEMSAAGFANVRILSFMMGSIAAHIATKKTEG